MYIGGTEKALLGLLSSIDYSQNEVYLGLLHKEGRLLGYVPKQVTINQICLDKDILGNDNLPTVKTILVYFRRRKPFRAIVFAFLSILSLLNKKYRYLLFQHVLKEEPILPDHYDEAYAFSGINELVTFYVAEKVSAEKKVCWIHFDVEKEYLTKPFFIHEMQYYQKIYLVSKQAKESFDRVFPTLAIKSEFHHNIVMKDQIISLSESGQTYEDEYPGTRLLTIARMSIEKGIQDALYTLRDLIQSGIQVRWYFIGDGPKMNDYKALAESLGIGRDAVFFGSMVNPYRYLKDCDIYVQPSRSEGFCIAITEAICLGKPIIATDFSGAREQLTGRDNSFIIGIHAPTLFEGIKRMVMDSAPNPDIIK